LIIVPVTILLNVFLPSAIIVILIIGGFYLAYEGVEKIAAYFFHKKKPEKKVTVEVLKQDPELEKEKIKSAITTDFILSVEIVIIALSAVLDKSLSVQILTLSVVSILATVGVYGIVALIVRMDDFGYSLIKGSNNKGILNAVGLLLVKSLPIVIRILAVVGTIALLLVSGGIFAHNIEFLHHLLPNWPTMLKEFLLGVVGGIISLILIAVVKKIIALFKK
jgi:predicted DNA repair protein MutK